jgi:hypothetical protein
MDAFKALLTEAVKIPKNLNSRLVKAGFDGQTSFKDHNDSFAKLSEVLSSAGLSVDVKNWEKVMIFDPEGENENEFSEIKLNKLDETGRKLGTLKNLKLYVMVEKLGRNKFGIMAETSR